MGVLTPIGLIFYQIVLEKKKEENYKKIVKAVAFESVNEIICTSKQGTKGSHDIYYFIIQLYLISDYLFGLYTIEQVFFFLVFMELVSSIEANL